LCLVSCGVVQKSTSEAIVLQVPLEADAAMANPRVQVKVNEVSTSMVVDTGSSHHVLTTRLASLLRLQSRGAEDSGPAVGPLSLELGGASMTLASAIVLPLPFDEEGWGGILSPQSLLTSDTKVIDFRNQMLYAVRGTPPTVDDWLSRRYGSMRRTKLVRTGMDFNAILIAGGRCGSRPVVLDVDSGASRSRLPRSQLTGVPLRPGGKLIDAQGVVSLSEIADGQSICLGDLRFDGIDVVAVSDPGSGPNATHSISGTIGMDILRHLVVIIPSASTRELTVFSHE